MPTMVAVAAGFSIGFAVAIVVLAASFAFAASGRLSGKTAYGLAALTGLGAVAAWIALALEPDLALAVAAAGLTVCALAHLGAYALSRLIRRGRALDADFTRAEERLRVLIDRESSDRAAELERTLAIARADSLSLLAEEERRLNDERRGSLLTREAQLRDELADLAERRAATGRASIHRVVGRPRPRAGAPRRTDRAASALGSAS